MNNTIIQLTSENIKRLHAVSITPSGSLVVIGGDNGAGKSSVLDSILYALGGERTHPETPVRLGAESAKAEVDLGDIIVRRTFTEAGGTALQVRNKSDGSRLGSPQAILDALVGKIGFDPLAFAALKAKAAGELLAGLVGLNFADYAAKRLKIYDARTEANRVVDHLKVRLGALPVVDPASVPAQQPLDELLEKQAAAFQHNSGNDLLRSGIVASRAALAALYEKRTAAQARITAIDLEIERLKSERGQQSSASNELDSAIIKATAKEKNMLSQAEAREDDFDLADFSRRINAVSASNAAAREVQRSVDERAKLAAELRTAEQPAAALHSALEALDAEFSAAVAAAKYPLPGLTVSTAGEVFFNGLPFSQASSAERIRVSVAIGLALNPKLRVLLLRDGSLLDEKNLAAIAEQAAAAGAQIWVERVSRGAECSVVIEDGRVLS